MTLTPLRALVIMTCIVLPLLAALGVAILQMGHDVWLGAALGAVGGVAVCVGIFLYSLSRAGQAAELDRWQWLIIAAGASGPVWSGLSSGWEPAFVGFLFGFLACFLVGMATLVGIRVLAESRNYGRSRHRV